MSGRRRGQVAEPDILRVGREFGQVVAAEYIQGVRDAETRRECNVPKGTGRARWLARGVREEPADALVGRRGRIDVLLELRDAGSGLPFLVLLEVKSTDWDRQRDHRVRPNLARHARQVWGYLEPLTERVDNGEIAWLQAALVYQRRPTRPITRLIEDELEQHGITVVWWEDLVEEA